MKLLVMNVQRALAQLNKFIMTTEKTFTLTFTEEQLNTVAVALNELPAKFANPVLQEITKQLQATQEVPAPEAE